MSNLANAVQLSGAGGWFDGNNLPPGDLANWFKWTPPATGNYFFTTRFARPQDVATNFKTQMGAFNLIQSPHTPVIDSDLTIINYLPGGAFINGVGYEVGSFIAFNVSDPTAIYYILVDSRDGSTGHFTLEWGAFNPETLGACDNCIPPTSGLCKAGGADLANRNAPFYPPIYISAGAFPPGLYVIQPCNAPETFTFQCLHSGGFETYSSIGSPRDCNNPSSPAPAGIDCITIGPCQPWLICHTGGAIGFRSQFIGLGAALGIPFPVAILPFVLSEQLKLTVKSFVNNDFTNGVDASAGYNYTLKITVTNGNLDYPTSQFETFTAQSTPDARIQLLSATGATGIAPSTSASFVLAGDASHDFTYSFDSTAIDRISGTFQITDCTGATYNADLVLGTSLVSFFQATFNQFCTGGPIKPTDMRVVLKNNGPVPAGSVVISFNSTTSGGVLFLQALPQPVCVGGGAASGTYGANGIFPLPVVPPFFTVGAGSGMLLAFDLGIIRNDAGQPLTQTISGTMTDAGLIIPSFSFGVTLL